MRTPNDSLGLPLYKRQIPNPNRIHKVAIGGICSSLTKIATFTFLLSFSFHIGCGSKSGDGNSATTSSVTSVNASCASPSIQTGQTSQCSSTVVGTGNYSSAVAWSADSGSISSSGLYTASATVPTTSKATITATSIQDSTKSGAATVNVTQTPTVTSVSVTASNPSITAGGTDQLTAVVNGVGNLSMQVQWSTSGPGTVSTSGLYTAPSSISSTTTVTVTATSVQDGTKTASAQITVNPVSSITAVSITCTPALIKISHSSQCVAIVQGVGGFDSTVTWSVDVGSINSSSGLFTAPGATGTATVKATSSQNSTISGSTALTITLHATVDEPDDLQGDQVHVLYVIPSDGVDNSLDLDGKIATSVASWTQWFSGQTSGSRVRLDTYQGTPDITFVQLRRSNAQMVAYGALLRDQIEYELLTQGFNKSNKIYLVYFDGGGADTNECGGGAMPPPLPGTVAAIYLKGLPTAPQPCSSNPFTMNVGVPGYLEFAAIHEIVHTLGFVPSCAPHYFQAHVSDSNTDLMYAGSLPWQPAVLDFNHDDYYLANITGCLDLSNSDFLDPVPSTANPPPGWPYTNLQPIACANESTIQSSGSTNTMIEFANGTGASASVYWLDGQGKRVLYKTLGPFEGYIQPTFATDSWVVTNAAGQCINIFSATSNLGHAIATKGP
jgi:hypothetical protein